MQRFHLHSAYKLYTPELIINKLGEALKFKLSVTSFQSFANAVVKTRCPPTEFPEATIQCYKWGHSYVAIEWRTLHLSLLQKEWFHACLQACILPMRQPSLFLHNQHS